jgi:trans-aconitate methyltransferase
MNRERRLDSYARELRIDPLAEAIARIRGGASATWLDLCCGTGRALIDAAKWLDSQPQPPALRIEGVDLIDMFDPNPYPAHLTLHAVSIERWTPSPGYALVTCVHGLHYVGDKLAAITRIVANLAPNGLFVANLDLASFRFANGKTASRRIAAWLRSARVEYNARRRTIRCEGPRTLAAPFRYLGADDRVGPNYTGQPAVASFYSAQTSEPE